MASEEPVHRPTKKSEFTIVFATSQAKKGWQDLVATRRNNLIDTWHFLTETPLQETPLSYRLRDTLGIVTRAGSEHARWQRKLSLSDGARIWYFVVGQTVYLEQVHTTHPNQTK